MDLVGCQLLDNSGGKWCFRQEHCWRKVSDDDNQCYWGTCPTDCGVNGMFKFIKSYGN